MDNQYFTPSIEDIRVGYECEYLDKRYIREDSDTIYKEHWITPKINWSNITLYSGEILKGLVRVPYLTKRQIETEGWEYIGGKLLSSAVQEFKKHSGTYDKEDDMTGSEYQLFYSTGSKNLSISRYTINFGKADKPYPGTGDPGCIFFGECKSINEFKTLMKWLKI